MKYHEMEDCATWESPTPHGVGGLKYVDPIPSIIGFESHPARGGWIEIDSASGFQTAKEGKRSTIPRLSYLSKL